MVERWEGEGAFVTGRGASRLSLFNGLLKNEE